MLRESNKRVLIKKERTGERGRPLAAGSAYLGSIKRYYRLSPNKPPELTT